MRPKPWLWLLTLALLTGYPAAAQRGQDRDDRSRGNRNPQEEREEAREREREWREYLKERRKAYKDRSRATREEEREFDRYLRERSRDGSGQDRQWREFLRERNQGYKPYSAATSREREEFDRYRRGTYPGEAGRNESGDQGRWGGFGTPSNGACFYTDADYRGNRFCMEAGERKEHVPDGYNDRISSVRLYGRARVTLYQDSNFRGSRQAVTADAPGLGGFNDRTSSIEVR